VKQKRGVNSIQLIQKRTKKLPSAVAKGKETKSERTHNTAKQQTNDEKHSKQNISSSNYKSHLELSTKIFFLPTKSG
jgi:hypothetical protein